MNVRALITALLFLAVPAVAAAECTAQLSWTAPTQNTDGSTLAKCSAQTSTGECLLGYKVYRGTSPSSLGTITQIADRNATSYLVPNLPDGTHYFSLTAYNGNSAESAQSSVVSKVCVTPKVPNPPSGVTVTMVAAQGATAYRMRQGVNTFDMVAFGTLSAPAECDMEHTVNGYGLVVRELVTRFSEIDPYPPQAYALCSANG